MTKGTDSVAAATEAAASGGEAAATIGADAVVETASAEEIERRNAIEEHGRTFGPEIVALDYDLRAHGISVADVIRKAAHTQFGVTDV